MAKTNPSTRAPEKTRFQAFETREVLRSRIVPAPYNPRVMSEDARAKLRKNLKTMGLLSTLVWNETTGHLVGGHQRLEQLDALEGYPVRKADYRLDVAVVRMDERQERAANLWLNNPDVQGEYNWDALAGEEWTGIDWDAAGFDAATLALIDQDFVEVGATASEVEGENKRIRESAKDRRKRAREQADAENAGDILVAVVFASAEEKRAWCEEHGVDPYQQYMKPNAFARLFQRRKR